MKLLTRQFVYCSAVLLPLFVANGCEKQKKAKLPPRGQAPTVAVVLPDELPLATAPEQPTPPPQEPPATTAATKSKPKKPAHNSGAKSKKTTPPPSSTSPSPSQQSGSDNQTVASLRPHNPVPEAIPETTLSAAVSSAQLQQRKDETAHMVDATENAVKGINRSLSEDEKSLKSQVESFLQQSRKATADGDYERAFNLAKKAQLLAEALVKK